MRVSHFLVQILTVFSAANARAELNCANGADPANDQLFKAYEANRDPLKLAFLESRKKSSTPICNAPPEKKQMLFAKDLAAACETVAETGGVKPRPMKKDCVIASTNRRPNGEQYLCNGSKAVSMGPATAKTAQCYNEELTEYVSFAIALASECISNEDPINSRTLLKKINNETTFNFTISGNGGRGLMQLTTPAVEEMTDTENGRALYIMQEVAASTKKSCAPFKHIAESDLAKPKAIKADNICDWTNAGDGLARNVLYGIGYHRHIRDKMIKPFLSERAPQLAANREIVSLLTAVSFGPEGIQGARKILLNNRVSKATNPAQLKTVLLKRSSYLRQGEEKMEELLCKQKNLKDNTNADCDTMKFTPEQIAGNTCVGR